MPHIPTPWGAIHIYKRVSLARQLRDWQSCFLTPKQTQWKLKSKYKLCKLFVLICTCHAALHAVSGIWVCMCIQYSHNSINFACYHWLLMYLITTICYIWYVLVELGSGSGSLGLGSSADQGHCVVFLSKTCITLTVTLSTHEYKYGYRR